MILTKSMAMQSHTTSSIKALKLLIHNKLPVLKSSHFIAISKACKLPLRGRRARTLHPTTHRDHLHPLFDLWLENIKCGQLFTN